MKHFSDLVLAAFGIVSDRMGIISACLRGAAVGYRFSIALGRPSGSFGLIRGLSIEVLALVRFAELFLKWGLAACSTGGADRALALHTHALVVPSYAFLSTTVSRRGF